MDAIDPYRHCGRSCTHDLGRGVLVSELLDRDGPYPDVRLVVAGGRRAWVLGQARPQDLPAA